MGEVIHKFFGIFLVLLRHVEVIILMCGGKKSKVILKGFFFSKGFIDVWGQQFNCLRTFAIILRVKT
jgi:hypothetical protein